MALLASLQIVCTLLVLWILLTSKCSLQAQCTQRIALLTVVARSLGTQSIVAACLWTILLYYHVVLRQHAVAMIASALASGQYHKHELQWVCACRRTS